MLNIQSNLRELLIPENKTDKMGNSNPPKNLRGVVSHKYLPKVLKSTYLSLKLQEN